MAREICKRSCKESPKLVLIGNTATAHGSGHPRCRAANGPEGALRFRGKRGTGLIYCVFWKKRKIRGVNCFVRFEFNFEYL